MPRMNALTLTPLQYEWFRLWASVDEHDNDMFEDDWDSAWNPFEPPQPKLEEMDVKEQPEALTRAALDACVGGSFTPGIEASGIMANPATYEDLFRISRLRNPGDLTQGLSTSKQVMRHWSR